jgi:catechol 2,3-dioxygenase-like lactoylglutathione lyase family enzyme
VRKRPTIPRLDGGPQTVLLVDDVDRALKFYAQRLRLEVKDADPGRYAELDTGEGGVLVLVKREGSIAPMATASAIEDRVTLSFTIAEDGYETWKKWFARHDVPLERESKWIHGGRSLFVRDPDGRRIEFKTPPLVKPPPPTPLPPKKDD